MDGDAHHHCEGKKTLHVINCDAVRWPVPKTLRGRESSCPKILAGIPICLISHILIVVIPEKYVHEIDEVRFLTQLNER